MIDVPPERRTALLVEVPVAEPVDDFRRIHLAASVARGLPAHITVLFPFASAVAVDADLRGRVEEHFRSQRAFAGELTHVDRFDSHVWLAPRPRDRFVALLEATYAEFPGFPPYGNAHGEAVPHLTIAEIAPGDSVERVTELAERDLGSSLPFAFPVDRVSLFEEATDGSWRRADSFELG